MKINKKAAITFGILCGLAVSGFLIESGVQSSWGTVDVSIVKIEDSDPLFPGEDGTMAAKLYVPDGVDASNPAPAVLAIHGYNNDKDVQRPHAIELSKRGIVVLAVDVLNHGDSDNVNRSTSNPVPFAALTYMKALDFVDETKIGVTGHSFGAFNTYVLAAFMDPTITAIAPIAFGFEVGSFYYGLARGGNPNIDILHIGSWGEEFIRDADVSIDQHEENGLTALNAFLGITDAEFGTTYGTFNAGATRVEMLKKTHPGQTHSRKSTVEITAFFMQSLLEVSEAEAYESINLKNTVFWIADLFGTISLASLVFSVIPLGLLLLNLKFFKEIGQSMPKYRDSYAAKPMGWWIFGLINTALGFLTYVFNTQYQKIPEGETEDIATWVFDGWTIGKFFADREIPLFKSMIGNTFLSFYVVNAGIMILVVLIWWIFIYRKKAVGFYQLGANFRVPADELVEGQAKPKGGVIIGKTLLLALSLILYMYFVTFIAWLFKVEIRGPWTALKILTWDRALEYLVYYPGVLLFFVFNAGIWMFGMMRQKEYGSEVKTVFIWWIKICAVMLTGLIIVNLLQYLPMYLGNSGPWLNDWAFAPMQVLQLWAFYPYAAAYFLILVIFYRKTGKIWLGSLTTAAIGTWMLVAGYLMYPVPL